MSSLKAVSLFCSSIKRKGKLYVKFSLHCPYLLFLSPALYVALLSRPIYLFMQKNRSLWFANLFIIFPHKNSTDGCRRREINWRMVWTKYSCTGVKVSKRVWHAPYSTISYASLHQLNIPSTQLFLPSH